ncbi:MAG: transposase [Eubacteriales bacterium]
MASNYSKKLFDDYTELTEQYEELIAENKILRHEHNLLQQEIRFRKQLEEQLTEKNAQIDALKKEILRLNGFCNNDSNNSGTPTSQTPIHKNKRIPNTREKTPNKKGGQRGHSKSKLETCRDDEITEHIEHVPETCPNCGGDIVQTQDEVTKDEMDYEVVVVKKRHHFHSYRCKECNQTFREVIPNHLKEENQYGTGVKSLSLLLMNMGNVSVNKARKMIYGLSNEELDPSEGFLIKQQKKAAVMLEAFELELKSEILRLPILYWDDTVIMIDKKRACLRFYGAESIALYKAHLQKNKEGLDSDYVLNLLPKDTVVMHDHNRVNYNEAYSFSNIECNAHLLRDLTKIIENQIHHEWAKELKDLINKTYKEREKRIIENIEEYSEREVSDFFAEYSQIMLKGIEENKNDTSYYGNEERKLLNRLMDYKDNYFAWVTNFELPFTNNLSERSLRGIKSKMKISGQFQTIEYATYYARIKSYIETGYRNGINEYLALERLCKGMPYTVKEIFQTESTED